MCLAGRVGRTHVGPRVGMWGRMWGRMRGVRGAVLWGDYLEQKGNSASSRAKQKPRSKSFGDLLVAPTGVDPVTFRFSVERSTN